MANKDKKEKDEYKFSRNKMENSYFEEKFCDFLLKNLHYEGNLFARRVNMLLVVLTGNISSCYCCGSAN